MKKLIVCILMLCSCSFAFIHKEYSPSECNLFDVDSIPAVIRITCKIIEDEKHIGDYMFKIEKSTNFCREGANIFTVIADTCDFAYGYRMCRTRDENGVLLYSTQVSTNVHDACLSVYQDLKRISKKYE